MLVSTLQVEAPSLYGLRKRSLFENETFFMQKKTETKR